LNWIELNWIEFIGLLYQLWMIDDDDCGAVSEVIEWHGKPKCSAETCPSAAVSTYIQHDLTWAWAQILEVTVQGPDESWPTPYIHKNCPLLYTIQKATNQTHHYVVYRMDVKTALKHPWLQFADKIPVDQYKIGTENLKNYYNRYR
jgi:hypothetical protein